jgi:hypothetical protein
MPLTLAVAPETPWRNLSPLLQHLGWQQQAPHTPSQLTPDTGPCLLLHVRPELAIAHMLDQGYSPEQALSEWQGAAQQLLDFYKHNRHQAVMADANAVAQYPENLIGWLAQNHPAFQGVTGGVELQACKPEQPHSLSLLVATQLVAQTPSLRSLLAQLGARSIPV